MAIYIDPPKWPAHGTRFSHLVSDTSYIELRRFAEILGLHERAFDQDHYDVPERLYREALEAGAIRVGGGELIRILRASGLRIMGKERTERLRIVLAEKWAQLVPANLTLGDSLLARWLEPHRRYHTVLHLHHCLESVELLSHQRGLSEVPIETLLAIWFHDAIYNGVSGEDEQDSAELARQELAGPLGEEVARLVLLTQNHTVEPGDTSGELVVDADLAILAANPQAYARYVHQVRDEYAHVPDSQWGAGRSRVLRYFLGRSAIFQSQWARVEWEPQARKNLSGESQLLKRPYRECP